MPKNSPIGIFVAAAAALATSSAYPNASFADDKSQDLGGLKEWTTDQELDAEATLDEAAQKAADEAKKSSICIPVGEGENCW